MKPIDIAVVIVWFATIGVATSWGFGVRRVDIPLGSGSDFRSVGVAVFIVLFFFAFAVVVPFVQRHQTAVLYRSWASDLVDRIWGPGTWGLFWEKLRWHRLLAVTLLTCGIVGLLSTHVSTRNWSAYVCSAWLLAMGLGFLVAHLLSRRFPPTLS